MSLTKILVYFHNNPLCQFCWQPKSIKAKFENIPAKLLDDYHVIISFVLDLSSKAYLNSANFVCINFQDTYFIEVLSLQPLFSYIFFFSSSFSFYITLIIVFLLYFFLKNRQYSSPYFYFIITLLAFWSYKIYFSLFLQGAKGTTSIQSPQYCRSCSCHWHLHMVLNLIT